MYNEDINKDMENKNVNESNEELNQQENISEENEKVESSETALNTQAVDGELIEESAPTEEQEAELEEMEALVELKTTYDYKTLKYANMYLIRVKRKSRLTYSIMIGLAFVFGILTVIMMEGSSKYMSIILFALGLWTLYGMLTEEKKIDNSLVKFFASHTAFSQNIKIDNEKIRVTAIVDGEERTGDYPWAYIKEISKITDYYLLFLGGGSPIILDRTAEAFIKGTAEDLEYIISDKAALKPYSEYNGKLASKMVDVKYYEPLDPTSSENVNPDNENNINDTDTQDKKED